MKEWTGRVEQITDKDWNNIKLWSFQIEGEARWFRTQKTRLPAEVGDVITFEERNNQVVLDSVRQATGETPPTTSALPVEAETSGTGVISAPMVTDVGARIQWQAARRDACNVIVAALHTEALPWASNVAKSKKLDLLLGYINELTKQFVEEETNG